MEFTGKETFYHFKIPQLEKLVLAGVLVKVLEDGEIKVEDEETKKILEKILEGLQSC